MEHQPGRKICLWQVRVKSASEVIVSREVIVTITEVKTRVPAEFSRRPVPFESLRGTGDDGKVYEKHWKFWPEVGSCDLNGYWTERTDGPLARRWVPVEAVYLYNEMSSRSIRGQRVALVDEAGEPVMMPKGDVDYCMEHDSYSHAGFDCPLCQVNDLAKRRKSQKPDLIGI